MTNELSFPMFPLEAVVLIPGALLPLHDRADLDTDDVADALRHLLPRFPDLGAEDLDALLSVEPGRAADALLLRLPVSARDKHRILAATDPRDRIDAVHGILDVLSGRSYPLRVRRGDPRLN